MIATASETDNWRATVAAGAVPAVEEALKIINAGCGARREATYGANSAEIALVVRDEPEGFGSRQAGERIRTKALDP